MTSNKADFKNKQPLKIAFISAGLGRISRGFEISSLTWYKELNSIEGISSRLFSGGKVDGSTKIQNCPRNGFIATCLKKLNLINDGCRLEQISFAIGLLPRLFFYNPNIIWLQEATLANTLLIFRKLFKFKYKIVFCDGAPVGYGFAKRFDYIIFLNSHAMTEAIDNGIDAEKCRVIPHICLQKTTTIDKAAARALFKLSPDKFVIICVAAWNKHHKRIDYLIKEMSNIKSEDVVLLLCGQNESETSILKSEASKIHIDVQWHTLSQEQLSNAYLASDLFVLPSLNEALGAVLIEAGLHGLPVICHQHEAAKYIFGDNYSGLADLSKSGSLYKKISVLRKDTALKNAGTNTFEIVYNKFNSTKLLNDFLRLVYSIQSA
jgi:1,2-diacylglycerol 3-alpha-glucosyltransferase